MLRDFSMWSPVIEYPVIDHHWVALCILEFYFPVFLLTFIASILNILHINKFKKMAIVFAQDVNEL